MRLVFAGTPEFALSSLTALHAAGHELAAVYTQPDRPAGRGRALRMSSVKRYALEHGLPLRQPASLKSPSEGEALQALAPEALIVVAYGLLLPRAILAIPPLGCLNVHASLLPRWRGAAPIQRAIEAGDTVTGVTVMQMDAGLDTGALLAAAETPIGEDDTAATLHDRLSALGAQTLVETLARLARRELAARAQDETRACPAPKLTKEEARIDWAQPAAVLHRKIRAFNPRPVAYSFLNGKPLRIWEVGALAASAPGTVPAAPGTVLAAGAQGILVQTGAGRLCLKRLQLEGGKPLAAADFLNGHPLPPGTVLGRT